MTPESATPGLALRDGLVINQAAILREMLVQALANGTRAVDLSAVSDCDTAGVQLLISARQMSVLTLATPTGHL